MITDMSLGVPRAPTASLSPDWHPNDRQAQGMSATRKAEATQVEVIPAGEIDTTTRAAWQTLRNANPDLWSPYFDIRMFDVLAQVAPHPKLAIVRQGNDIIALLPFQGKKGGLARPLGAPLSDQHNLIHAADNQLDFARVINAIGMAGFVFVGLRQPVPSALKLQKSMCHVADLSGGLDAYVAWRKSNWNDQVKKNERRKRQGERQWGPMRLEIACPKTSTHFETLMALKQAKYVETNRHNILAVPWINAFLRQLYQSSDPDFVGEISLLYFGDHLAAMEFGLRAGPVMHSWFPTFDRAYAQVSPGILLMDAMIEHCGTRGITKVDLGIGHDQYKRHASNAPVPVWSGTLPVAPLRRATTKLLADIDAWLIAHLPQAQGQILGKLERRSEMILASEPTFAGRVRGYINALKAIG
jgi:CelD/BcsL family acetyltransferase involved in cellulose biosynthesis